MTPEWASRTGQAPAYVQDVTNPDPLAGVVEVGDEVVLRVERQPEVDVFVRVDERKADAMRGTISRANPIGVRGDTALAKDAEVEFSDRNVIRLVKKADE